MDASHADDRSARGVVHAGCRPSRPARGCRCCPRREPAPTRRRDRPAPTAGAAVSARNASQHRDAASASHHGGLRARYLLSRICHGEAGPRSRGSILRGSGSQSLMTVPREPHRRQELPMTTGGAAPGQRQRAAREHADRAAADPRLHAVHVVPDHGRLRRAGDGLRGAGAHPRLGHRGPGTRARCLPPPTSACCSARCIFSMVADKIGRRPVLVAATFFFSVLTIATAYAQDLHAAAVAAVHLRHRPGLHHPQRHGARRRVQPEASRASR